VQIASRHTPIHVARADTARLSLRHAVLPHCAAQPYVLGRILTTAAVVRAHGLRAARTTQHRHHHGGDHHHGRHPLHADYYYRAAAPSAATAATTSGGINQQLDGPR